MKARNDQKLTVLLFCGFLAVMCLLYLLLPKQDFSRTEKRYLAELPELSVENIGDGGFSDETADYMADHMPFRSFFVGLNAYYELLSGRQGLQEIHILEKGRLAEAPVSWSQSVVERNMSAINSFGEAAEIPVDLMLIPSAGWAYGETHREYTDDTMIDDIYALADSTVKPCSVTDVFAGGAELYYRTDHHWTSLGAWSCYRAYMEQLQMPYREQAAFTVESVDGFRGSTYSRSGLWLTPAEPIALWHGSERVTVTNAENNTPHEGVFYRERLEEADMYTVYLDGNHSLVRIENPDALTDETLLVVRDSYTNCLGSFLAETYGTVILVDLRYYRQPVSELCAAEQADRVLVCYSIGNFMTDTNIPWLK